MAKYKYLVTCMLLITQLMYAQKGKDTILILDTIIDASLNTSYGDSVAKFDIINFKPTAQPRRVPNSIVNSLKQNDDFWYANTTTQVKMKENKVGKRESGGLSFYRQAWFKTLLWFIIIGAFVAVVIWYLYISNIRLFSKPSLVFGKSTDIDEQDDIYAISYDHEIKNSLSLKDYRLTVRFHYLHTLKLLSERGVIQYKPEKTNSDYLLQLYKTEYFNDFFRLTRDFDYTWYGKFEITDAAFQTMHSDFITFKNRLQQ